MLSTEKKVEMAESRAQSAESKVASAIAAVEAAAAEVAELKKREAEAAVSQSGVLRAFAEKIFLSGQFSALVNSLAGVLNKKVVVKTLDAVAADIPELDKAKYGYGDVSNQAIFDGYAEVLAQGMRAFPVVDSLASSTTFLSAGDISRCPVDKDEALEAAIAQLRESMEKEVEEEPIAEVGEKEAPSTRPESEQPAGGFTSSVLPNFDLTSLTPEIRNLNRVLDAKETEILHLKGVLGHVRDEAEVKALSAQEKYDELLARLVEAEEKLEVYETNSKRITEEHAEYEAIIRRNSGLTISEAEAKIGEIVDRCRDYKARYGENSWQLREQKEELRKIGSLFKTLSDRDPQLKRFLAARVEPSVAEASASRSVPTTTINRSYPAGYHERERRRSGRGQGVGNAAGQRSSSASGRGRGRGGDFCDRWFSFSRRPPGASS